MLAPALILVATAVALLVLRAIGDLDADARAQARDRHPTAGRRLELRDPPVHVHRIPNPEVPYVADDPEPES